LSGGLYVCIDAWLSFRGILMFPGFRPSRTPQQLKQRYHQVWSPTFGTGRPLSKADNTTCVATKDPLTAMLCTLRTASSISYRRSEEQRSPANEHLMVVVPAFDTGGASHVATSTCVSSELLRRFAGIIKARKNATGSACVDISILID